MKMTIKLNIGNYQSLDMETNEYKSMKDCYDEILKFLRHWSEYTDTATLLVAHIEKIAC